jgi:alcohol dehydrogenase (cytochrome c)
MQAPTPGGSSDVHFGNNGFFDALDAAGGGFRHAAPYGQGIDWTAGLDANGRPLEYRDDAAQQVYLGRETWEAVPGCPNVLSTPAFAATLSARTGLAYGAGAEGCAPGLVPVRTPTARGWYGGYYAGAVDAIGALAAVDPATGAVAATRVFEYPLHAGALSTAGGLVFTTTADGTLHALNDETLETIWSQHFATLAPVPPITFAVDGRQHVAVVVGGNALSGGLSDRPTGMSITEALYVLLVLRLPE